MARPGHYKAIQSSNPLLEVKRAGKKHPCAGVAVERGARPGVLKDVWMLGRSKRCVETIKANEYYVSNMILPQHVLATLPNYDQCWPTCLACAIQTYPEAFSGPLVADFLPPMTPERHQHVLRGIGKILKEAREMAIESNGDFTEPG